MTFLIGGLSLAWYFDNVAGPIILCDLPPCWGNTDCNLEIRKFSGNNVLKVHQSWQAWGSVFYQGLSTGRDRGSVLPWSSLLLCPFSPRNDAWKLCFLKKGVTLIGIVIFRQTDMAEGGTRRDTDDIHGGSGHTGRSTSEERSFRSKDCTAVLGAPSRPHPLRFSNTLISVWCLECFLSGSSSSATTSHKRWL